MRKQKGPTPSDPGIKIPKIRKFATPTSSQTRPSSQSINSSQLVDPVSNDLQKSLQIWNHAQKNQISLSEDDVKIPEMENRIATANKEIIRLKNSIVKAKEDHQKLAKYIKEKCETQDTIIKHQNTATHLTSSIQENIEIIINTREHCEESQVLRTQLYNIMALKKKQTKKDLIQKFNDQVSLKQKESENQLALKCNELLMLQTGCEQFEKEIKEKLRLENETINKIKEYEVTIDDMKKQYDEESSEYSKVIKEHEKMLNIQQDANEKLEAENNEDFAKYNELFSKYKALEIIDSEEENDIKCLQSTEIELQKNLMDLNNKLEELKNIDLEFISNTDLELAEYRKQLHNLTTVHAKTADEIKDAILSNEELTNTATKLAEDNMEVERLLKNEDDEIMKIGINLRNELDKYKEWNDKIQTQNKELIELKREIRESTVDFETQETERDEKDKREAKIYADLTLIEEQLSNECREFEKLFKQAGNEKIESSEQAKKCEEELKQIDNLIAKEQKIKSDLQQKIEHKKVENKKEIQCASISSKQCQSAGHAKKIKEQNITIGNLNRELSEGKQKHKQANERKDASDNQERAKYETKAKGMQSHYDDLEKKLTTINQENEKVMNELKQAKVLIETKNSDPERIPMTSSLKPILKSTPNASPLKPQKVHFDLGSSPDECSINISEMFDAAERRYATSGNRPDWSNLQIPATPDEPDTTSLGTQPSQPRKFFKSPRTKGNSIRRFFK